MFVYVKNIPLPVRVFLFTTALFTVCIFFVYAEVQQVMRMDANDPQIQMAEDYAEAVKANIRTGMPMTMTISPVKVDIEKSLSPYFALFDANGNSMGGNGSYGSADISIPKSIFENPKLKSFGQLRFTWQPEPGVRQAVVLVNVGNSYVLVGRSLREVERREDNALAMALFTWVGMVIGASIMGLVLFRK